MTTPLLHDDTEHYIKVGKCSGCGKPAVHGICKKCMDKNEIKALKEEAAKLRSALDEIYRKYREGIRFNVTILEIERMLEYAKNVPDGVVTLRSVSWGCGNSLHIGTPPECWGDRTLFKSISDLDKI